MGHSHVGILQQRRRVPTYEYCIGSYLVSRDPDLEKNIVITHTALFTQFEKAIGDFPEHGCCCCERLHQRKSVSVVSLTDEFNSDELKCFILEKKPSCFKSNIVYV